MSVFRCVRMYEIMDDYIFEKGRDTQTHVYKINLQIVMKFVMNNAQIMVGVIYFYINAYVW